MLTERGHIDVQVFYTQAPESTQFDKGFGQEVTWDIPLLDGYAYQFLTAGNRSNNNALIRAIAAWSPDAILVNGWNPPGHLSVMRYFKGKKLVWFRGDSHLLDEKPGIIKIIRRTFLTWVYRYVDTAFYVGTFNKAYYLAHGLTEKQLVFTPHAIENERFFDASERGYEIKAQTWKNDLGITEGAFTIVFAGKLESKKGPDILIKAIIELNLKYKSKPVHLIVIGNGSLYHRLHTETQKYNFIHFLGFQNQSLMPIVYRLGDIFCLPSKGPNETWGLAINEAFACNRPAIVSDKVGCWKDLVFPDNTGFIVQSENLFNSLINQINLIIQERKNLQSMGINAKKLVSDWSFEKICFELEKKIT